MKEKRKKMVHMKVAGSHDVEILLASARAAIVFVLGIWYKLKTRLSCEVGTFVELSKQTYLCKLLFCYFIPGTKYIFY